MNYKGMMVEKPTKTWTFFDPLNKIVTNSKPCFWWYAIIICQEF
jgi:hypothetical protein